MRIVVTDEERAVIERVLERAAEAYASSNDRDLPHVHRPEAIAVRDRGGHVGIGIVSSWDYHPEWVETTATAPGEGGNGLSGLTPPAPPLPFRGKRRRGGRDEGGERRRRERRQAGKPAPRYDG